MLLPVEDAGVNGTSPGAFNEARCDEAVKKFLSICFSLGGLEVMLLELFADGLNIGVGSMGANDGFSLVSAQGALENSHHEALFCSKQGHIIRTGGAMISEDIMEILSFSLNGQFLVEIMPCSFL